MRVCYQSIRLHSYTPTLLHSYTPSNFIIKITASLRVQNRPAFKA